MDGRKRSTTSRSDSINHPNFDDPAEFVDNVNDDELLADILKKQPNESTGMEAVVIMDGLPVGVKPSDRLEKLKNLIRNILAKQTGAAPTDIINERFAMGEEGTLGFAFFEFKHPDQAKKAVDAMRAYPMDKSHVLTVDLFTDFEKFHDYNEEWIEPEPRAYKEIGNLGSWMENEDSYDQFLCIFGEGDKKTTGVYWNTPVEASTVSQKENWTDSFAMWSPLGSYLATFHQKGVALWGGDELKQITRFVHPGIKSAVFSPKERFVATIRNPPIYQARDEESLVIWDIITSARKRDFPWDGRSPSPAKSFSWSHDDSYCALMLVPETISVYDTKTFTLLNKETIKISGLMDFSWSPSQNYIAYWVQEAPNVPARVGLMEIPSKNDKRTKQLFNVNECAFYWQKNGEYLAVKVQRYKKKKEKEVKERGGAGEEFVYSGQFYNLEIFTLTSRKDVPVESVEIKDHIVDLAWEPNGSKLVVITTSDKIYSVSIYGGRQDKTFELTKKMTLRHPAERITWSPMGQFVVLHTPSQGGTGHLTFIDTAENVILLDMEHFLLSDVQWDPTGRYLAAITSGQNKKDNAYTIFTFQGRYVRTEKLEGLRTFLWRPRPPTLLSAEKQKEIRKNIKKYSADFEMRDRMQLSKASREVTERRKKQLDEFKKLMDQRAEYLKQARRKLLDLRGGLDTESMDAHPDELVEEELEVIRNITITAVG